MDLRRVGVALPFGSRSKGTSHIVGVAVVLLICSGEVTFVAVVATGLLVSLSPSNLRRKKSTATPHEAIFMFPLMDWSTL